MEQLLLELRRSCGHLVALEAAAARLCLRLGLRDLRRSALLATPLLSLL